jgi:hypothetical protein
MTAIDCTDCYLAIELGDGVKRALVRHFAGFIAAQLAASSAVARDGAAAEKLDREAWRLASRVLAEVEAELAGALDEALLMPDPQRSAQDILAKVVSESVEAVERHYLGDDLLGFAALLAKIEPAGLGAASSPSV